MPGIETDALDTAGAVFVAVLAVGCAGWGGLAVLRPGRPPQPITGPVWVVRVWGIAHVLLGVCMAVRMTALLVGAAPAWPMTLLHWVAGPLLLLSVAAAGVSERRARVRAGGVAGRRHGRRG